MTTQVTYQGIEYTVNDGETVDDLLRKEGFEEAHQNNVLQMTSELVAPTLEEQEMLKREERWTLLQQCLTCLPTFVELDLKQYSSVFEH